MVKRQDIVQRIIAVIVSKFRLHIGYKTGLIPVTAALGTKSISQIKLYGSVFWLAAKRVKWLILWLNQVVFKLKLKYRKA